jgi:hypothetical protein
MPQLSPNAVLRSPPCPFDGNEPSFLCLLSLLFTLLACRPRLIWKRRQSRQDSSQEDHTLQTGIYQHTKDVLQRACGISSAHSPCKGGDAQECAQDAKHQRNYTSWCETNYSVPINVSYHTRLYAGRRKERELLTQPAAVAGRRLRR